ncbi:MAG: sigma 54-interacting transcriptional regulator [Verrucomicrobiota bacterium]
MQRNQGLPFSYSANPLPEAIGISESFIDFQESLSAVAKIDRPVLIIGERGTGKELAASRLHYLSQRWDGPLIALNCAALAESILESELFGHEAGAFTGAVKRRTGRFEAAEGGTLFLDEIGLTSIAIQEKLLRAVEYSVFERVGSSEPIDVDVRIIGATNADLRKMAKDGKFKEDLLDRLSFEVLHIPPLRLRAGDVEHLGMHFAASMAQELQLTSTPSFSASALKQLNNYDWPGNVRELKNVIERSVYRHQDRTISSIEFDPFRPPYSEIPIKRESYVAPTESLPLQAEIAHLEKRRLEQALQTAKHKQAEAAATLGLTYHQFRGLYRKHFPKKS